MADEIRADILKRGVSDRGVFRQHYDTDALDASTLLAALTGAEGSFLICSFWLVNAFAMVGEEQRARDLMERILQDRLREWG